MNNLYQQLNQSNQNNMMDGIKNMANKFKAITNPQAYLQEQLQNNPQLNSILRASNGNYEQAFRNLASQMNVDPDEIIKMLK